MAHSKRLPIARRVLALLVLTIVMPATAGWFDSDGSNYDECMELRRAELKTTAQVHIAHRYCLSKHPSGESKQSRPRREDEFSKYYAYRVDDGAERRGVRSAISRIDIKPKPVLRYDNLLNEYKLEVNVFNKNSFALEGLYVGFAGPSNNQKCTPDRTYDQIVLCAGQAQPNLSSTFECTLKLEPPTKFCVLGFVVYQHPQDVEAFAAQLEKSVALNPAASAPRPDGGSVPGKTSVGTTTK